MQVIGINQQESAIIIKLVAAILHCGNLNFYEDDKGNAVIADPQGILIFLLVYSFTFLLIVFQIVLELAAGMLEVEPFTLQSAILFRVVNTGQAGGRTSTYNVPQNVEQATYARDALGKSIYNKVFDFLILRINEALAKNKAPFKTVIGVLDIFGFEIFEKNGFEQFCINYVNEKLQQFFIELTLKAEQEEYNQEGIKWEPIKYFNNQIVCELMEGKAPPGIFSVCDDICATIHSTSKGTDLKFLQKMGGAFSSHLHFRGFDTEFAIKHYAGEVKYQVDGFCDKNKDTLFNDLIETLQSSRNAFLVKLFPEDTKDTSARKRPTTAGFKIKSSAQKLMQTLAACTPHYIRCIKPNETKKALDWDHPRVKHQVQYLGLLENVRVRRAGFAYRAEFARFLRRYKKLSKKTWSMRGEWSGDPKQGCITLLEDLALQDGQWQLGKTKVFIRHPETLFHLEELLERHDHDCAVKIQRAWKKWKAKKHALEQRALAADKLRGKKERNQASVNRQFDGDYIRYEDNYALQECVTKGEQAMFADQVIKLNRRNKPERRDMIVTNQAVYFILRKKKKGAVIYQLARRTPISTIGSLSMSTLCDNYLVIHCPSEYDNLFELERKTEAATVIMEQYKISSGRDLNIEFNDNINYKIKTKDTRTAKFTKNEAAVQAILKKSGKVLNVQIKSGLPKDTDTTPKNFANRGAVKAKPAGPGPARGGAAAGGGPARGAASPAVGGGGGAGAGGRVNSVVPPSGGAARGGPARGGASVVPPSGGAGPARGAAVPAMGGGAGARGSVRGASPIGGGGGAPPGRGGGAPPGRGAPPPSRGPPPRQPAKPQARALYDYDAANDDELTFKEGDVITILQKDQAGWWEGEINGRKGWVPANYIKEI